MRPLDAVLKDLEAAWNEPDADQRQVRLERSWANDGVYVTAGGRVEGRDALLGHLGAALAQRGGRLEISGEPEPLDGRVRFGTAIKTPNGETLASEVAFAELDPDGVVKRLTTFPDAPRARSSRVRRVFGWATKNPVQFFAIVGGGLYILLRVSVAIFYAHLNVTPEEAGLDEAQVLRESVLMLSASLITAFVWAVFIAAAFLAWKFILYPLTSHVNKLRHGPRSTNPEKARHVLVPGVSLVVLALPPLVLVMNLVPSESVPQVSWFLLALTPLTTLFAAVLAVVFYESFGTVFDHATTRVREALAGKAGAAIFGAGVLLLALLTIVAFPILARVRAQDVRDGAAIDGQFEPWQAQRAEVKWKLDKAPFALPGCKSLRYLGSESGTVLLFDSSTHVTYRVSADDVVVRTRGTRSCPGADGSAGSG